MRKSILIATIAAIVGTVAGAQEPPLRLVYFGVEPAVMWSDDDGAEFDNEYFLGVTLPLGSNWALDSTLSWRDPSLQYSFACNEAGGPCLLTDTLGLDLFPLYEIPTEGGWNPYVGFGARLEYVDYENSFSGFSDSWQAISPGIALGFTVPFSERFSFQLDGRYYPRYEAIGETEDFSVRNYESNRSDKLIRLGLGWRF